MFLCVPVFVLDRTLRNNFGSLQKVFGHLRINYYRTPTKNLGTLKIKNVTPINVKRLAGIGVLCIFLSHMPNFLANAGRNGKLQSD